MVDIGFSMGKQTESWCYNHSTMYKRIVSSSSSKGIRGATSPHPPLDLTPPGQQPAGRTNFMV